MKALSPQLLMTWPYLTIQVSTQGFTSSEKDVPKCFLYPPSPYLTFWTLITIETTFFSLSFFLICFPYWNEMFMNTWTLNISLLYSPTPQVSNRISYIVSNQYFFFWLYFTLQYCIGFAIHWDESTMDVYKLPVLNPPPTSHPISSLWIILMPQPQASCTLYRT